MWSKSFDTPHYIILWDKLDKKSKELLDELDIPKTNLTILTHKDTKGIPKKFKHQIKIEPYFPKPNIVNTLKKLFKKGNREEVKKELNDFEARHILLWLESMSAIYPELAKKMEKVEKYVYSPFFHDILLYELEGLGCVPRFIKRKDDAEAV